MDIATILGNALTAMSDVKTYEMMLEDVNYLRGEGAVHRAGSNNGGHGNPTFETVQRLDTISQQLTSAKEQASLAYETAVYELERIRNQDEEMHKILFLRYMKRYTWQQIANYFGEGFSSDAIKQRHNRYLRGQNKADARRC